MADLEKSVCPYCHTVQTFEIDQLITGVGNNVMGPGHVPTTYITLLTCPNCGGSHRKPK